MQEVLFNQSRPTDNSNLITDQGQINTPISWVTDKRCLQKVLAEELKSNGEYLLSKLVIEGFLEKVPVNAKQRGTC